MLVHNLDQPKNHTHSNRSFAELNLPKQLQDALQDMGFTSMTFIQDQSFESVGAGRDLIACSQTGSGKTIAFLLPILCRLIDDPSQNALVLTPTRELATQVHEVVIQLSRRIENFRCALIMGGGRMQRQHLALKRNPRIVVATPGRLLDHLYNHSLKLKASSIVVLDEADRMLDMGFAPQIDRIFETLPSERQTLLFSATFAGAVQKLINRITRNPVSVTVKSTEASKPRIHETFLNVEVAAKTDVLADEILKREGSILVFVRTKSRVDRISRKLKSAGILNESIHGGRTMGQRRRAMENFKDGSYRVLIATDIAARGLDVDNVGHVINFDAPQVPDDYTHRIGRTGRAGKEGQALSLVSSEDRDLWAQVRRDKGGEHGGSKGAHGGHGARGGQRHSRRPSQGSRRPQVRLHQESDSRQPEEKKKMGFFAYKRLMKKHKQKSGKSHSHK